MLYNKLKIVMRYKSRGIKSIVSRFALVLILLLSGLSIFAPQKAQASETYKFFDPETIGATGNEDSPFNSPRIFKWDGVTSSGLYVATEDAEFNNCGSIRFAINVNPDNEEYRGDLGTKSNPNNCSLDGITRNDFLINMNGQGAALKESKAFAGESLPGDEENPSCESSGEEMSWLLCPLLRGIDKTLSWLDDTIEELLTVPVSDSDGKGYMQDKQLIQVWANLRNIAYAVLIPIMLIMVIGTALNFEFVSAYTVKRALPRLVLAVIFMTLSFEVMKFLVVVSNNVGLGLKGLILAPFGDVRLATIFNPGGEHDVAFGFAGIVTAGGVATFGGIITILSFAATAAIGMFIGLLLLAFRQVLIVGLAILAPVAILAWIFPGNDRLWKLWWGSFSKLLLLFPLIAILIAGGKALASVVHDVEGGTLSTILKLIAYAGPYFLIPATFKLAGGAFATIAGMANNRSRGVFDRLRKGRQDRYGKNKEAIKAGNRFKGENVFSKRASRALQTASLAPAGGLTLNTARRRARVQTARSARNFEDAMKFIKESDAAQPIINDDDKLWAARNANSEADVRKELMIRGGDRFKNKVALDQATAEVMRFKREAGSETGKIAATIAQAGTGTGYNYRFDGVEDDMFNAIIDASGNDRGLAGRMMGAMRPMAMQSGRVGLAGGGFAKAMITLDQRRQALANKELGRGEVIDIKDDKGNVIGTKSMTKDDARLEIMQDVLQSNAGAAVAGKVEDVKQLAPVMKATLDQAMSSGNTVQIARELAKVAGKYDAASQVAPQNAEALADEVLAQGVVFSNLPQSSRDMLLAGLQDTNPVLYNAVASGQQNGITYQQAIDALRGNDDFKTMRREYQTAGLSAAREAEARTRASLDPNAEIYGQFINRPPGT